MKKEILELLTVLGIVQGAFLGTVLLTVRRNRTPNIFLAGFLLALATGMTLGYLSLQGIKFWHYNIHYFAIVIPGLFGPLIFLYADTLLHKVEELKIQFIYHLIFPAMVLLTGCFLFLLLPDHTRAKDVPGLKYYFLTVLGISVALGLGYTVAALYRLIKYRRDVLQFFSTVEKLNLRWLQVLLTIILLVVLTWNFSYWTGIMLGIKGWFGARVFTQSMLVILIFLITYKAIKQPEIFGFTTMMEKELQEAEQKDASAPESKAKYEKQTIDSETMNIYMASIIRYMEESRPFLNESLTLKDLAENLEIPAHHVSMTINTKRDQNFYHFINSYRVNTAKLMISGEDDSTKSFLEVAYDAGFSSKTTFNTMFKKFTGMTPTEYRNSLK